MKRLTTRSIATAQAIRDREDFRTSGALMGESTGRLTAWDSGRLNGADLDQFLLDREYIDYVVWSYRTPIAWHWTSANPTADPTEGWHKVNQKFSPTTGKHQSNLYLIPTEPVDEPVDEPEAEVYGACGVANCTDCLPLFDKDNNEVVG